METVKTKRYHELDSLRGVAAMTVVIHHYLLIFPSLFPYSKIAESTPLKWLAFSPLHIFWAGYEAVILFFILSGFVLSLPYIGGRKMHYQPFLIKRIFRIYVPYLVSILLAIALKSFFWHGETGGLSLWVLETRFSVSAQSFLQHLILIGDLSSPSDLNPVIWSLRPEMQMSILFPIILWVGNFFYWPAAILAGLALSWSGYAFERLEIMRYILMFILGSLIARHRGSLVARFQKLPGILRMFLFCTGVMGYCSRWLFYGWFSQHRFGRDCLVALGASLFIVIALSAGKVRDLLLTRALLFLGKISYSLYLYHAIVLLTFLGIWHGKVPLAFLLPAAFVTTLGISALFYYAVEKPSVNLAAKLSIKNPFSVRPEPLYE